MVINLRELEIKSGSVEGARALFEQLIIHLLKVKHRTIRNIRSAPGDWGIDAYIGELASGTCMIWQCKYFPDGFDDSQKDQIRKSFKTACEKSDEQGFTIDVWTLCVPCDLSAPETVWWEGWSKRQNKSTGIKIDLMVETDIVSMLLTSDAEAVRKGFFGDEPYLLQYYMSVSGLEERPILRVPDPSTYDNSLFIKKLIVAGIGETLAARTQFFNAELLKTEIHDKGDEEEIKELTSLYEKIRSMWEPKFNKATMSDNPDLEIPRVYFDMLHSIQDNDKTSLITPRLMASFVHKQGFMQQLADLCEIGWTEEFRSIDTKDGDNDGNQ